MLSTAIDALEDRDLVGVDDGDRELEHVVDVAARLRRRGTLSGTPGGGDSAA